MILILIYLRLEAISSLSLRQHSQGEVPHPAVSPGVDGTRVKQSLLLEIN